MGAKSNSKGAQGEREVVNLLNAGLGTELERNPYRQRKEAGHYDVSGLDWLALEVKRYQTASQGQVTAWWAETLAEAGRDQVPVLAYRADRQGWRFVVPLSWWRNPYPDLTWRDREPVELTERAFIDMVGDILARLELFN